MKCFNAVARMAAVGVLMAIAGSATAQQTYPNSAIRVIVPLAPAGSVSILARLVSQKLAESWSQQLILDHRPGGNGVIGSEALIKSPPDGYTILVVTSAHIINPSLVSTRYDAIKDFAPVATIASSELILVVHPSVPANDLREFIALAKSKPGQLNYASTGTGAPTHLAAESFSILAGVKMQNIPYKGGSPALTDLIGGQVQLYFGGVIGVVDHIKAGSVKALAISGETRFPALPQIPTFSEAGLPGLYAKYWTGVLAPAGTPKTVINKMSTEIAKILVMPAFREKLAGQGMNPFISTPEQFVALMKADLEWYGKIIKTANIKADQ